MTFAEAVEIAKSEKKVKNCLNWLVDGPPQEVAISEHTRRDPCLQVGDRWI